jgi:DNA mismatch repair protein MutS
MPTAPGSSSSAGAPAVTPAMRQYLDAKQQYRDAILFFRMGDFYEMFYEDALVASRALELTLTSRAKDPQGTSIPMCGIPHHALDGYLARLVKKGFRVAICDQVEDPRKAKGIVKREIVRVVSPGTLTDAQYLDAKEPAFLMSITPETRIPGPESRPSASSGRPERQLEGRQGTVPRWGVALLDLSTGEFSCAEYSGAAGLQSLADEISVLRPREVVAPVDLDLKAMFGEPVAAALQVTRVEAWLFEHESSRRRLLEQLHTTGLEGFGLEGHGGAVAAAGALLHYLRDTQKADLAHVRTIALKTTADCLLIDAITLRHLEIVESMEGGADGSLLHEIDRTMTPMGGRMLRSWLLRPLVTLDRIHDRLDAVEEFAFRSTDRGKFRELLKTVHDLERLVARTALGSAGPRDLIGLKQSIAAVPRIRLTLGACEAPLIQTLVSALDDLTDVRDTIEAHLIEEPGALVRDGGYIRDGVDGELDDLRRISRSGKQIIAELEAHERERTGISSLKVRYNRVFGYYIEISKSNLHAVPPDYHRKQTIAGGERFITPALKEHEEKVLGADERILEREVELFEQLRGRVAAEAARIQETARALASLDSLAGLAETASVCNYIKPQVHDGEELQIADGRHPVVERRCSGAFVPNDVDFDPITSQLVILTGPNMGGKSTYLRQTALACVMAQAGSFVPATRAKIGLVDRVYARVGASDNITRGQSTFMVEMQETANILHGASSRSLVVLDEIGRGTATFDGLSIAWAVAEYLATNPRGRPKTLFATHYHELTDLADALPGVINAHVAAREWQDDIVFLHKIVPGRSDRSYGIQVARLAGMPASVITRARAILQALEHDELARGGRPSISGTPAEPQQQLGLFQAGAPINEKAEKLAERVRALDTDSMTPLQALTLLTELKKDADQ